MRAGALFVLVAGAIMSTASAFQTVTGFHNAIARTAVSRQASRSAVSMRARVCDLTGKKPNRQAMTVTFSHKRNKRVQAVNLQTRKLWWEEGNRYVSLRISTKALRTIEKYGLDRAAKKYELDLSKF